MEYILAQIYKIQISVEDTQLAWNKFKGKSIKPVNRKKINDYHWSQ